MRRIPMVAAWVTVSLPVLSGCSTGQGGVTSSSAATTSRASAVSAGSVASTPAGQVAVTFSMGGHTWPAHLNNSQAAQSLASRLPLTLSFRDFAQGFDEKVSDLDQALPFDQMTAGDDPTPGDIAYRSPDQRLVLYWGDVARYDGIHVIGSFDDSDATSAVRAVTPDTQVTITRAD